MFSLAHVSDLHMALPPKLSELAGKRALGFINWQRKRKYIHRPELLDAITRDLKACGADHVAVTGDLVNLSLGGEYRRARTWLDDLGAHRDVTVVPGNHDIYVRSVEGAPAAYWGDYMAGDDGRKGFPFVRRRGDVALIALCTGVPTGPFMATGRLGRQQLADLAQSLETARGMFRVVLIHHPPVTPPVHYPRRLTDDAELRSVLAAHGAELLLHGHDHRRTVVWLDGPGGGKVPAVGVPSASARIRRARDRGGEDSAGYNIFRIDGRAGAWRCEMIARTGTADGVVAESSRETLSAKPSGTDG